MNFLNGFALLFLPLVFLPLLSLFLKAKPSRIQIVSWLLLVTKSEIDRKRRIHRNLIIILRCFILFLILLFVSRPVPAILKFDRIYVKNSPLFEHRRKDIEKFIKETVGYYGDRVRIFTNESEIESLLALEGNVSRYYVLSNFSRPLTAYSSKGEFFYDTLFIQNAGIKDVDYSLISDSLYILFHNYNLPDTVFKCIVRDSVGELWTGEVTAGKGEYAQFRIKLPESSGLVSIKILPVDDVDLDNALVFSRPLPGITYHMEGDNIYLRSFFNSFLRSSAKEDARILVSVGKLPIPGRNTDKVIIFTDRYSEFLNNLGVQESAEIGPVEVSGWEFSRILFFQKGYAGDISSLLKKSTFSTTVQNMDYSVIGIVPDPDQNEAVYCPYFWNHILDITNVGLPRRYSIDRNKVGGVFNDTLFILDTLEANTERIYIEGFEKNWLQRSRFLRTIRLLKTLFAGLILSLVILEAYLSFRFLE